MKIFVINPGSTSTKLALYENGAAVVSREFQHDKATLSKFGSVMAQKTFRMGVIRQVLEESEIHGTSLNGVAGRGGLLHPMPGGVYNVNDDMIDDLNDAKYGEHPCNLGAVLARDLAAEWSVPAFIVDPVVTDELMPEARLTGMPEIERRSLFHALSQRGAARTAATRLGVEYEASNFIVCHMGGGISIGAHRQGRVVDVVNALDGEGPFTPERTGGLPIVPVIEMIEKEQLTLAEVRQTVLRQGGLFAHLGTNDLREVVRRVEDGDKHAGVLFSGLAYGIAKSIGSLAPVLVDAFGGVLIQGVVLTGGLARSESLVNEIQRMVGFLGPVEVVTGDEEMAALAAGAERVLRGEEVAGVYRKE